jgi:hypothetical protein
MKQRVRPAIVLAFFFSAPEMIFCSALSSVSEPLLDLRDKSGYQPPASPRRISAFSARRLKSAFEFQLSNPVAGNLRASGLGFHAAAC